MVRFHRQVAVESKALRSAAEVVMTQVLSHLRATGLRRGPIINFGEAKLVDGIRRVSL